VRLQLRIIDHADHFSSQRCLRRPEALRFWRPKGRRASADSEVHVPPARSTQPRQRLQSAREEQLRQSRIGADHVPQPKTDARVALARSVEERGNVTGSVPSRYQKKRLHQHFTRTPPHTLVERLREARLGRFQVRKTDVRAVPRLRLDGLRELRNDGVCPRVTTAVVDDHDSAFHVSTPNRPRRFRSASAAGPICLLALGRLYSKGLDILHQTAERVQPDAPEPGEAISLELTRTQRRLEAIYQLEPTPAIAPFVRIEAHGREQLIVRQSIDQLELVVLLPESAVQALMANRPEHEMDAYLNAIEGISHFIHLAERARVQLPTTLLELELQAEVDKFAILTDGPFESGTLQHLHRRLYEDVRYVHAEATEVGRRYRLANELAAKLWSQLIPHGHTPETRSVLRRFYRAGQADKIRMACAA